MLKGIFILLSFCLQFTTASAQADWKLIAEEKEIKVFSKTVSYSKIKAIKVECEMKASNSQLVALLLDVSSAEKWVYHTKSATLLKKVSASELFYYSEISLPWPVDNRDFVAHVKVTQDPVTKVVTVNAPAVPGWVEDKKGIVRINQSKGYWVISPAEKGNIRLEYTLQVDPGGDIPAWAVNMFAAQGPIETFKNMRRELESAKYKNATFPFIAN